MSSRNGFGKEWLYHLSWHVVEYAYGSFKIAAVCTSLAKKCFLFKSGMYRFLSATNHIELPPIP